MKPYNIYKTTNQKYNNPENKNKKSSCTFWTTMAAEWMLFSTTIAAEWMLFVLSQNSKKNLQPFSSIKTICNFWHLLKISAPHVSFPLGFKMARIQICPLGFKFSHSVDLNFLYYSQIRVFQNNWAVDESMKMSGKVVLTRIDINNNARRDNLRCSERFPTHSTHPTFRLPELITAVQRYQWMPYSSHGWWMVLTPDRLALNTSLSSI